MGKPRSEVISADQPNAEHPQFVTALARGLAILRCFERGTQYLGNNEIAAATGLPKPTVSRLTFTLISLGHLTYLPAQEKYALGMAVLSLGHAFLKGNNIVTIAHPLMRDLADYAQSAVMLASANTRCDTHAPGAVKDSAIRTSHVSSHRSPTNVLPSDRKR